MRLYACFLQDAPPPPPGTGEAPHRTLYALAFFAIYEGWRCDDLIGLPASLKSKTSFGGGEHSGPIQPARGRFAIAYDAAGSRTWSSSEYTMSRWHRVEEGCLGWQHTFHARGLTTMGDDNAREAFGVVGWWTIGWDL